MNLDTYIISLPEFPSSSFSKPKPFMVGITEEPPRQLAPSVKNAATEFCYPGGISQVRHQHHQ
jgi:hypothetical protein